MCIVWGSSGGLKQFANSWQRQYLAEAAAGEHTEILKLQIYSLTVPMCPCAGSTCLPVLTSFNNSKDNTKKLACATTSSDISHTHSSPGHCSTWQLPCAAGLPSAGRVHQALCTSPGRHARGHCSTVRHSAGPPWLLFTHPADGSGKLQVCMCVPQGYAAACQLDKMCGPLLGPLRVMQGPGLGSRP